MALLPVLWPAFRISYCTADRLHDKVFAYIAQNTHNGTLECHAYLCSKRKEVRAWDYRFHGLWFLGPVASDKV